MKTIYKIIFGVLLGLVVICPISIAMNFFIIRHNAKLQYHIDYRDSLIDEMQKRQLEHFKRIDSLEFELFKLNYNPL
ncbi:hypothetical protein BC792_12735 [Sphingobacterium allocomposti]|uniref:Uncharacterized protein n=1 Tax=Sphingobacterium allocomposti TaxID=415956 RepID=A0A5S5D203_9SPHI|nr:hypothetical protein [Sphingobacterium composti Yoo et al. 2007 non Ten et al. 2007]TYP89434.1 hypothetical protein BC792_12735 [Sphingobacterium composti Yoo et al. 2007 non Ten et al. 2007]